MSQARLILWAVTWIAGTASSAFALPANCPQKICACIGEARRYAAVAVTDLKLRNHKINYGYGSFYTASPFSNGPVCAQTSTAVGSRDGAAELDYFFIAATAGAALKVKGKYVPSDGVLLYIDHDLVTGGGAIVAEPGSIHVGGVTDTSGTHPSATSCQQAIADAAAVSDELAALTPTRTLPPIIADGGYTGTVELEVGPGVDIIETPSISIRPMKTYGRYYEGTELLIIVQPGTQSVIINTHRLSLGPACLISVIGGSAAVLINMVDGGPVKMNHDVNVEPAILGPRSNMIARYRTHTSALFGGKITLRGAGVNEEYYPSPCSPSGAFLDGVD
jgi:hypothetical protein